MIFSNEATISQTFGELTEIICYAKRTHAKAGTPQYNGKILGCYLIILLQNYTLY